MLAPYHAACELAVARYRKATGKGTVVTPAPGGSPDRDPRLGPYRIESDGALQLAKEQHTAYDQALVDRFPWLRPSREAMQSAACGVAPALQARGLIQLRSTKEERARK